MSKVHTTKTGDTLFSIAIRYYGDGNKYPILSEANPLVKDSEKIIPGINIVIPNLPERKI